MKKRAPLSKLNHQKVGFQIFFNEKCIKYMEVGSDFGNKKRWEKKQRNKQEVGKCDISGITERPFIEILASHDCYNFTITCYQVWMDIQQNQ